MIRAGAVFTKGSSIEVLERKAKGVQGQSGLPQIILCDMNDVL